MVNNINLKKLSYSALFLALALLLPFLVGQIPAIATMFSPMHIPVLLCGFVCGWPWGLVVGFAAPLLRSALFGIPVMFPGAVSMAFELATYGAMTGLLYRLLPKKIWCIYLSLISAMVCGRIVWGAVRFIIAGLQNTTFSFAMFISGAVTAAVPGIILHIVLIPLLVIALKRTKLILND